LNDGQIPNPNVVRVSPGTDYNRVEGNRRASRNGRVSDLPPEIPNVPIRNFSPSQKLTRVSSPGAEGSRSPLDKTSSHGRSGKRFRSVSRMASFDTTKPQLSRQQAQKRVMGVVVGMTSSINEQEFVVRSR
jgi:hypothetical protein